MQNKTQSMLESQTFIPICIRNRLLKLPSEFVRRILPKSTITSNGSPDWKSSGKMTWGAQMSNFIVHRLQFSFKIGKIQNNQEQEKALLVT